MRVGCTAPNSIKINEYSEHHQHYCTRRRDSLNTDKKKKRSICRLLVFVFFVDIFATPCFTLSSLSDWKRSLASSCIHISSICQEISFHHIHEMRWFFSGTRLFLCLCAHASEFKVIVDQWWAKEHVCIAAVWKRPNHVLFLVLCL